MTQPIYLILHFKETKKAIAAHIRAYNDKLKVENPTEYRALKIKSPVVQTVNAILTAYSRFLLINKSQGLTNPVFKINNQAIHTMLDGLRSMSTIWRHIKRATAAGILDSSKYVFHGSNSSFELGFNPAVLVACHNEEYSKMLLDTYNQNVNNPPISVSISVDLIAERPSFQDTFNGCMLSFCKHIVPVEPLQVHHIYMDKVGNVDKSEMAVPAAARKNDCSVGTVRSFEFVNITGEPPIASAIDKNKNLSQEHGCWDSPTEKTLVKAAIESLEARVKQEQVAPAKISKPAPKEASDLLNFYIERSIVIALRLLYVDDSRVFTEADINCAKHHLRKYYLQSDKKMSQLYLDLNLIITECYKSKERKHFRPAHIRNYFDSNCPVGFYRSRVHVEEVVKPYMEKQADFNKSFNALVKIINWNLKFPNDSASYLKSAQYLGKKKNKTYLNIFNAVVSNAVTLNTSTAQQYFNKNVIN